MPKAERQGPDPDVPAIVEAASRGDADAWRELVALYGRRVYALVRSRCRRDDIAEEVTQSVFVTVAEQLGSKGYSERGRFESWLFLIAMNRLRDEMRRERRRPATVTQGDEQAQPDAGPAGADPEELRRLREAMERLSDADRTIIELRHHAGLGFRQIAEVLHEPVGTLLARHHRALAKLRDMLAADAERAPEGRAS